MTADGDAASRSAGAAGRAVSWRTAAFLCLVLLVAAGALAFRLPRLSERPMHGDEANQAYKAGILLETGAYAYDPYEHHGPTLYYLTLPVAWLTSAKTFAETTEFTYRIVPVLFGVGLILLLLGLGDGLGPAAAVCAGILTAISPAMVFYSRYYVQEMLLVFFTFATIVAGWRYTRTPKLRWALLAGACVGLTHATKETCVVAYASMAGALTLVAVWGRLRDGQPLDVARLRGAVNRRHLIAFALAAAAVSVVLFTSFFTHAAGPLDSIRTYGAYLTRAGGEGSSGIHDKPCYYYLCLLTFFRGSSQTWWSEGLILGLAVVGLAAALMARTSPANDTDAPDQAATRAHVQLARFLAFYTVLMIAFYAAIPYKTPWCLINFLHPMTLLAGLGVVALMRWARVWPARAVVCLLLIAGAAQLAGQACKANFRLYADPRNPYVYAHPVPGIRRLVRRADELAAVHPDGTHLVIKVMAPGADYWPIPWYLRHFDRVGFWGQVPDDADADIVVVSPKLAEPLAERLRNTYEAEYIGLRPGVFMRVLIDQDLWDAFMRTRT
ncbi:MAG: TIGR03663 family protein [Candidatus Hydrogenedentes bacterium]|nr:TIGR03663 family protein [Candidatus Hydrogenedentota bacterium]